MSFFALVKSKCYHDKTFYLPTLIIKTSTSTNLNYRLYTIGKIEKYKGKNTYFEGKTRVSLILLISRLLGPIMVGSSFPLCSLRIAKLLEHYVHFLIVVRKILTATLVD